MAGRRWTSVIVGLFLLLIGVVFALQGANVIGGSAVMSGNSTYIYVGAVVALIGLILLALGVRSRPRPSPASAGETAAPSSTG